MNYFKNTNKKSRDNAHIIIDFVAPAGSGKSTLIKKVNELLEKRNSNLKIRLDGGKNHQEKAVKKIHLNKKIKAFLSETKKTIYALLCFVKNPGISLFYIRYVFSSQQYNNFLSKISWCLYFIKSRGEWIREWQNKKGIKAIHLTEAGMGWFLADLYAKKNNQNLEQLKAILEESGVSLPKCQYLIIGIKCEKETLLRRIFLRGYKGPESNSYLKSNMLFDEKIQAYDYVIQNYKTINNNAKLLFIDNRNKSNIKDGALKIIEFIDDMAT